MKYMLMVHNDEAAVAKLPPDEIERVVVAHAAYTEALRRAGVLFYSGHRLRPGAEMVRVRQPRGPNGERTAMDGPHTETKEVIGGFYLLDCATKEEAVQWAKQCPMWDSDTLELRPVWDMGAPAQGSLVENSG
jgi:hypothetical protein